MYANPSLQRNMWTVVLYKVRLIGAIVNRETQHTRNMWTKSNCLLLLVLLFTIVNSPIPETNDGEFSFNTSKYSCNNAIFRLLIA